MLVALSVQTRCGPPRAAAERGRDGVPAGDGRADGLRVHHVGAYDGEQRVGLGQFGRVADHGGHVVAGRAGLPYELLAGAAGGAENGDLHGCLL
nr:hypothetical protein [Fodinicola feengrottensis]